MPARATSLADALQASAELAYVLTALERSRRIAELIADAVKPAGFDARASGACNWRSASQLLLTALTAAQAAKLKQLLPRLESLLHCNGFEGIQIRIRVQPDMTTYPIEGQSVATNKDASTSGPRAAALRVPTDASLAFARKLAQTNVQSPVAEAAAHLTKVLERCLTRTRYPGNS